MKKIRDGRHPLNGSSNHTWNGKNLSRFALAFLGVMNLGATHSLKTKEGTLIVEADPADATVRVLDQEGKIQITRPGTKAELFISVDAGRHRLKIEKEGFEIFSQEFEIKSGGKKSITAKLVPLEDQSEIKGTKKALAFRTETFEKWAKNVATLPAEKQVAAVAKKLQELNPGFDGKIAHQIKEGRVVMLQMGTDRVTDLSPVRAVSEGLTQLLCHGSTFGKGKVTDLTPLSGLKLTELNCGFNQIADLSPLQAMPLTKLNCDGNPIQDLTQIKDLPLEHLDIQRTLVSDLSPLPRTKLSTLYCTGSKVQDLSPLTGIPLSGLLCGQTQLADLSPLAGMKLATLHIFETQVADLSPLKGMPISNFNCSQTKVTDISPLASCTSLKKLEMKNLNVSTEALASLRKSLPDCLIEASQPK